MDALAAAMARHPAGKARACQCVCLLAHPGAMLPCGGTALTLRWLDSTPSGPSLMPLCWPCATMQGVTGGSYQPCTGIRDGGR